MHCIDNRKVNELVKGDRFPLPGVNSCLDTLSKSQFFSSCGLHWGCWRAEVDERDRDGTAFVTCGGQWRFRVLGFGLCGTPGRFAWIMELVMSGLAYGTCLVWLDDILVFSRTFGELCGGLAATFGRLEQCVLGLGPAGCHLFRCRVTFLGRVVSVSGIGSDPEKVAAVAKWPRPADVSEVRTFVAWLPIVGPLCRILPGWPGPCAAWLGGSLWVGCQLWGGLPGAQVALDFCSHSCGAARWGHVHP